MECKDPRVYDENDQVLGVKDKQPPKWEARVPKLPGLWNQKMEVEGNEKVTLKIVDCAWYYGKVDDLLKLIKDPDNVDNRLVFHAKRIHFGENHNFWNCQQNQDGN